MSEPEKRMACYNSEQQVGTALVQHEFLFPGIVLRSRRLIRFAQQEVFSRQVIHPGSHEASIGVCRRTHNRLTAHVEGGIHEHTAPGELSETLEQRMEERIGIAVDSLDTRRVVHVSNRRNGRSWHVEFVDTAE